MIEWGSALAYFAGLLVAAFFGVVMGAVYEATREEDKGKKTRLWALGLSEEGPVRKIVYRDKEILEVSEKSGWEVCSVEAEGEDANNPLFINVTLRPLREKKAEEKLDYHPADNPEKLQVGDQMKKQFVEDMSLMEDAMVRVSGRSDIWQDRTIYAMALSIYHILSWIIRRCEANGEAR